MTHEDFGILLQRRIDLIKSSLASKSKEYSSIGDKLHNFNQAALLKSFYSNDDNPLSALQGMLNKHLVSYFGIISGVYSDKKYDREYIDEKLGDIINYFILAEAILIENYLKEK